MPLEVERYVGSGLVVCASFVNATTFGMMVNIMGFTSAMLCQPKWRPSM